ncbi:hypothetical protein HYQ44_017806 [Verticillium longisporum]|nr:hypothetical protein HYQ44_017806 [Verticillium longisporum]
MIQIDLLKQNGLPNLVIGVVRPAIDADLDNLPVSMVLPLDTGGGFSSSGDGGQGMSAGSKTGVSLASSS